MCEVVEMKSDKVYRSQIVGARLSMREMDLVQQVPKKRLVTRAPALRL